MAEKPEEDEDKRDAFGRAVNPSSRKRDRSPSSSSESSSSEAEDAPKKKQEVTSSPPRKKRVRNVRRSRSRSSPRRNERKRERPVRRRSKDRGRSRSRTPPITQRRKKPKSFKEFILKLPDDISPEKAQTEFKKYLNQFDKSREAVFFGEHKDEGWFKAKYDPIIIEEQTRERAVYSQQEAKKFVEDFIAGKLKEAISQDCRDGLATLPGWTAEKDNEGNGTDTITVDASNKSASREGENPEETEKAEAMDIDDSAVNAEDKVDASASKTEEWIDVSASKAEETVEDANMTEEKDEPETETMNTESMPDTLTETMNTEGMPETLPEGEGEPSAESDETPGISMKKPGEQRPEAQEFRGPQSDSYRNDSKDYNGIRPCHDDQVFIQGIPLATPREKLEEVFRKAKGFKELYLSDPSRGDRRIQNGWAAFETQEDCQKVMREEAQGGLNGKRITAAYYLTLFPKRKPRDRIHYVHQVFLHPERVTHEFNQCLELIKKFDKQNNIHEHNLFTPETLDPMQSDLHRLNLCLEYLSRVHLIGYYETRRFRTRGKMLAKQPQKIIRNRGDYSRGTKPEPFDVENDVDEFVKSQLENEDNEIHENNWEERKRIKLATENTKEVKAGQKYRCALCLKAFKGANYVQKHILLKHKPIVVMYLGKQREKEMLQNYSKDKHKITAAWFRSDDRGRGRGRWHNNNNRFGGHNNRHFRRPQNHPSKGARKELGMDAPPPHKFDHTGPIMLKPADTVRTVRSYEEVGDDLGIDDLLDFGFGDFQQNPKFNCSFLYVKL